jgi:hypothetical protein
MPLVYPLDLRTIVDSGVPPIAPSSFNLRVSAATARLPAITQVMEVAPRIWVAEYTLQARNPAQQRQIGAFLSALGGPLQFLGFHPGHLRPMDSLLPDTASALAFTGNTITISIASGRVVTAGDMIGVEQGGRYGLYRALETVTAAAAAATVQVAPTIHPGAFTPGAAVRFTRPVARMILDPAEQQNVPLSPLASIISFRAMQAGY